MQLSLLHVIILDNEQYPNLINASSYDGIPIVRHESVTVWINILVLCALFHEEESKWPKAAQIEA